MEELMTKGEAQEMKAKLEALKDDFTDVVRTTKDRVVNETTTWAKEHPAAAVGIVAGVAIAVGFTLGVLVGRRGNRD